MTRTQQKARKSASSKGSKAHQQSTKSSGKIWGWLAIGLPVLAILALVALGGNAPEEQSSVGTAAPAFALPTTAGTTQDLDAILAEGDALLYFSMGVGCDGCFAQIPEIEQALTDRGIQLVPVMVDPPDVVNAEAARFGIDMPILIDGDRSVSKAYDMIGVYGHGDRPSHSFAYVEQDGTISWVHHYAEMFVPQDALLSALPAGA